MQAIGSMLRRTSHQITRQRELFALRAHKATTSFVGETRDAGRDLAGAVRTEADAWGKYVRETATAATGTLTPRTLERTLLLRVSLALRALDARLHARLGASGGRKRVRTTVKPANGAAKARSRRHGAHTSARAS
jgi:hypothetical protein